MRRRYLILGGIFAHSFIALNGSPIQNRASKTSENDGDFCYGHTLCPPDGAQLGNVCELQRHERALFY